tara:strand:+ start:4783 stop:5358 length:576 start_codon:yes stop_codon:yes gene_type:complete
MYWKKLLKWSPKSKLKQNQFKFIEGSITNIRTKKVDDLELDYIWRTDPLLCALDATVPIEISIKHFINQETDDLKFPVPWSEKFAIETKEGKHIGNCMYYDIDMINQEAEVGIMIGDKNYWDKGYGCDALNTLVDYIFEFTNIHRLYLHTLLTNKRAQNSFKKSGFKKVKEVRKEGMNFMFMEIKKNLEKT